MDLEIAVLVYLGGLLWWTAHPHLVVRWDRWRGRVEQPTRFLTWNVVGKVFRHYHEEELTWQQHKLVDQAQARRAIARRDAGLLRARTGRTHGAAVEQA